MFLALEPIEEEGEKASKEERLIYEAKFDVGARKEGFWEESPRWAEKGAVGFSELRIVEGLNEGLDGQGDGSDGRGIFVHPNA